MPGRDIPAGRSPSQAALLALALGWFALLPHDGMRRRARDHPRALRRAGLADRGAVAGRARRLARRSSASCSPRRTSGPRRGVRDRRLLRERRGWASQRYRAAGARRQPRRDRAARAHRGHADRRARGRRHDARRVPGRARRRRPPSTSPSTSCSPAACSPSWTGCRCASVLRPPAQLLPGARAHRRAHARRRRGLRALRHWEPAPSSCCSSSRSRTWRGSSSRRASARRSTRRCRGACCPASCARSTGATAAPRGTPPRSPPSRATSPTEAGMSAPRPGARAHRRAAARHRLASRCPTACSSATARCARRTGRRSAATPSSAPTSCATSASTARCAEIVRAHHERIDGRGYPDGLAGDDDPGDRPDRRGRRGLRHAHGGGHVPHADDVLRGAHRAAPRRRPPARRALRRGPRAAARGPRPGLPPRGRRGLRPRARDGGADRELDRAGAGAEPAPPDGAARRARPLAAAQPQGAGGAARGRRAAPAAAAPALRRAHRRRATLGPPVCCVFEGWDASGKGGAIKRLVADLDPRHVRVASFARRRTTRSATTSSGASGPRCPAGAAWPCSTAPGTAGCSSSASRGSRPRTQWRRAYERDRRLRAHARRRGHGAREVLAARLPGGAARALRARARGDPLKSWKLTDEDWRNREQAPGLRGGGRGDARAHRHPRGAPWILVEGDSKRWARVKVLEETIKAIEAGMLRAGVPVPDPL